MEMKHTQMILKKWKKKKKKKKKREREREKKRTPTSGPVGWRLAVNMQMRREKAPGHFHFFSGPSIECDDSA